MEHEIAVGIPRPQWLDVLSAPEFLLLKRLPGHWQLGADQRDTHIALILINATFVLPFALLAQRFIVRGLTLGAVEG
jgi:hypothetical protein